MTTKPMFCVVRRPAGVTSRYDLVVVDGKGFPHYPLTTFYHEFHQYGADGTAKTYLNPLLAYFAYLETDAWRLHRQDCWDSPPDAVRESVRDYLVEHLHCKARHKEHYQFVSLTIKSPSTVRIFLSALKQFYHIARRFGWYAHAHPLLDQTVFLMQEIKAEEQRTAGQRPRMPQQSGVEEPGHQHLSENYFKLTNNEWQPHPIDDPDLHTLLRKGFNLVNLRLRDQIVVRMAYESGARIREMLRLTVGDWRKRGAQQEAWAFSKGSHGRRVKVIRWSTTTTRMLHTYVNTERITFDPTHRRLDALDDAAPLFLSSRGNPYDYDTFKKHWYALCQRLQIDLNIHGLRHWFVTQEIRLIYETAQTEADIERGKADLVRYMAWRNPETLLAYQHYFDEIRHAQLQDHLHHKWDNEVHSYQQQAELAQPAPAKAVVSSPDSLVQPDASCGWEQLLALGGETHA